MIVTIDVDGTVADLVSEWTRKHNLLYGGNLGREDITNYNVRDWKINCTVAEMHDILKHPDLYDKVKPLENALAGVDSIREAGHRVVFNSTCVPHTSDDKFDWLLREGFLGKVPSKLGVMFNDWIVITDKSLLRADVLIDDKPENVRGFQGIGILYDQPYNRDAADLIRLTDWNKISKLMETIVEDGYYAGTW